MRGDADPRELVASADVVLLDTNILLVFLLGSVDESLIRTCSRLSGYRVEDYRLIGQLLALAKRLVITPHVATEVWNLGENAVTGKHRTGFVQQYRAFVGRCKESQPKLSALMRCKVFDRIGTADTGLFFLGRKRRVIFTDDGSLCRELERSRCPVVNINHIRFAVS